MSDEYTARQRAITLRLAGRPVKYICQALGRSEFWFHKWWRRYLDFGSSGLYDLTRAHQAPTRVLPELERTILSVRRRLQAHAQPRTRYALIGASAILAELKGLNVRPLPSTRTIERVLQRRGVTLPRERLPRLLPRQDYPSPQARQSNDLHEVDLVGPIYLKGRRQRYYIWVGKDRFDGAVCLRLADSRQMEAVLTFLGECWKALGRPAQIQLDNARELAGWGPGARYLSRVIRLCLRYGVEPVLIPPGEPQCNGSVENFNGWFQLPLLQRHFARPGDLRRELARLEEAVNTQHVHPRLGGRTPATSPGIAAAKAAAALRRADRGAADRDRAGHLHPPGEHRRDGQRAQSDVPRRQAPPGAVPAGRAGHRARLADGVPQRPPAEALALQAVERLTDP
jgi:transposase InsO family protein